MFAVLAFVAFVIAAVLAFLAPSIELRDIVGVIAVGLAFLALAGAPIAEWRQRV